MMFSTVFTYKQTPVKLCTLKPGQIFILNRDFKHTRDAEIYMRCDYMHDSYQLPSAIQIVGPKVGTMILMQSDRDVYLVTDAWLDSKGED